MKSEERHAFLDLCIPYVFGRLNPGNRKQFEAHLATGCEPCTRELAELHEAMALLPLLLKQQAAPPAVRDRVLRRISAGKAEQPVRKVPVEGQGIEQAPVGRARSWYGYAFVVLSILIIVVVAVFVNDLIGTIGGQERKLTELQSELQRRDDVLNVLRSERLEIVALNGVEASPAAGGRILWDPAKKTAILQLVNVPVTPANEEYQLWVIRNGRPTGAATFAVTNDKERESLFKVINLPVGEKQEIDGFSITLEPKGGSTQPTGSTYLRGASR